MITNRQRMDEVVIGVDYNGVMPDAHYIGEIQNTQGVELSDGHDQGG